MRKFRISNQFEIRGEDCSILKPFFDHLVANAYLSTSAGQKLIWDTHALWVGCLKDGSAIDEKKEQQLQKAFSALVDYLLQDYLKHATALGYEIDDGYEVV